MVAGVGGRGQAGGWRRFDYWDRPVFVNGATLGERAWMVTPLPASEDSMSEIL
jgi:hypothetical protein